MPVHALSFAQRARRKMAAFVQTSLSPMPNIELIAAHGVARGVAARHALLLQSDRFHARRRAALRDHRAIGFGQERVSAHARAARCLRRGLRHVARRAHWTRRDSGVSAACGVYRAAARHARWHRRGQSALSVHAEDLSRCPVRSCKRNEARAGRRSRRGLSRQVRERSVRRRSADHGACARAATRARCAVAR